MPVQRTAPGMQHRKIPAIDPPIVLLKLLERLRSRREQRLAGDPVVEREELVQRLRDGEYDVEVRTIRQTLTDLLRPLHLTGTETVRAVTITARTRIPLLAVTVLTVRQVVTQRAFATVRDQVQRRILLLGEATWPQVTPTAQNIIDCRIDTVTMNSVLMKVKHPTTPFALIYLSYPLIF